MSDKELLELAAKAAGLRITWGEKYHVGDAEVDCTDMPFYVTEDREESPAYWNPLEDDGDALRLAVKLRINVCFSQPEEESSEQYSWTVWREREFDEGGDPASATRRAIVRAAAELGATHD